MLPDEFRLTRLLERLAELERRPAAAHELPILEVGRASLLDAIRDISHRLHDGDYCRRVGIPSTWRGSRDLARQLHEEADLAKDEDDLL